jgi:hypothetical protein
MGDSHDADEVCSEQIHVHAPDASSGMHNQTGRSDKAAPGQKMGQIQGGLKGNEK